MLKKLPITVLLVVFVTLQAFGPPGTWRVSKGSISFRSDAPLEMIKAASNELQGVIVAEKKSFGFKIKVNTFKGFNGGLQQEHFNENYLETDKYPYATFEGKIIEDVDFDKDGTTSVRTKGNLTIHGVTQERIIKSDLTIKSGVASIKSNFTVLLADHNITIPKVVHEKLASEIKVEVKADLSVQ